jgi:hypothetical protein
MAFSNSATIANCSLTIINNRIPQNIHIAFFTQGLEVCFEACNIAKKDIIRKNISIQRHHDGAAAQQMSEHVLAIKIRGVIKQCIMQSVLAIIPIVSDFRIFSFIFIQYLQPRCKYNEEFNYCNIVAIIKF